MPEFKNTAGFVAWFKFKINTTVIDPPELELKIKSDISSMLEKTTCIDQLDDSKDNHQIYESLVSSLIETVIDWDLTLDGEKIPCTVENKDIYLSVLLWEHPLDKSGKTLETWLWIYAYMQIALYFRDLNKFGVPIWPIIDKARDSSN